MIVFFPSVRVAVELFPYLLESARVPFAWIYESVRPCLGEKVTLLLWRHGCCELDGNGKLLDELPSPKSCPKRRGQGKLYWMFALANSSIWILRYRGCFQLREGHMGLVALMGRRLKSNEPDQEKTLLTDTQLKYAFLNVCLEFKVWLITNIYADFFVFFFFFPIFVCWVDELSVKTKH